MQAGGPSRTFICQASELLTVMPPIRYYVDMKLARQPGLTARVESFCAAHDLLCSMLSSKAHGNVPPDTLHALAASHIEKFKAAYGTEHMRPKQHDEFHIGDNAVKLDGAMDCFAQERKGAAMRKRE